MSYIVTYYDVLPQLLHNLLDCIIQHTTYLLPCGLLSRLSRPMWDNPSLSPINHSNCIHALRCKPSDNIHYPFSYQLTSWFVWKSAPPVTFRSLKFPASRLVSKRSFPYTCFTVTSTGLISERTLASVSRFA